ncbi:SigE family RNA polymerase sigma factor [Catellatospora paridis]|uniref:SigE family RNA polymerase sigma factor n=1 Tax=Catellatospora paridis TaxID=1617086 RepID=UPI002E7B08A5|nr:SigE family RNA polymerase sigma factor [Catellatospora paridis]
MDRYDGFHDFVVARGGALSRTAYLLTGEHHAAEDLVQTALAKAAARWRQIVAHGQPEAYVRRIMINERITWWRRRPARPVAQVPDWAGPDEPRQIVDRITLGQALDTLTPRQRTVVVLRFYEDLSEAETADAMGCSIGTVKSQTHVALGHLRRALPLFAEQAGQYADADAALTTARTRRARRVVTAAALALLPAVLAVAVYALRAPATPPPMLTPSPSVSPEPVGLGIVPTLPSSLPAAGTALPDLPADRGVGRASLVRSQSTADGVVLQIAAESGWYQLRLQSQARYIRLSPDGRWLSWTDRQSSTVLRDLAGATQRRLPGEVRAWSRSGRHVLLANNFPALPFVHTPADGTSREMTLVTGWNESLTVLDDGTLLRGDDDRTITAGSFPLAVTDPATGALRQFTVDVGALMRPGETIGVLNTTPRLYQVHDDVVAVQADTRGAAHGVLFFEFSLRDGAPLRRLDLGERAGRDSSLSFPCLQGETLLWREERALRQSVPGGATDLATLDLGFSDGTVHLPGCLLDIA